MVLYKRTAILSGILFALLLGLWVWQTNVMPENPFGWFSVLYVILGGLALGLMYKGFQETNKLSEIRRKWNLQKWEKLFQNWLLNAALSWFCTILVLYACYGLFIGG